MKTIYLFTKDSERFTSETVLIWLSVGSSQRSLVKLRLVEQFCIDCGYFLRVRDDDTDFFYMERARQLRPESNMPSQYLRQASMSIESFYKMIIDGRLEVFCQSLTLPKSFFRNISLIDEKYSRKHLDNLKPNLAPFCQRKYLSKKNTDELIKTVACIAALFVLFLLDAFGSHILNLE